MAILEYLEEVYPTPALLPVTPIDRARVRRMAEVVNSGIQPIHCVSCKSSREIFGWKSPNLSWSHDWIQAGFVALEQLVVQHGGRYSFEYHHLCGPL